MKKLLKRLEKIEEFFCGASFLFAALLLFINVVLRYVFRTGLGWAEEVIRYTIIWMSLIGMSVCIRKDEHSTVDFILTYVGDRGKKFFKIFSYFVCLVFCVFLFYYGVKSVRWLSQTGQITPALQIPMFVPYLSMPVGAFLTSIRLLEMILNQFSLKKSNSSIYRRELTSKEG